MSTFIRLVISDTGAGHRACAEAIAAAIGSRATLDIVDPLVASDVAAVRRASTIYDWFGVHRGAWGLLWYLLDSPARARLLSDPVWLTAPRTYTEIVNADDPDLVVVLHPCLTVGARRALRGRRGRTALAIVVTDPVTPHASWFEPDVDLMIVSTDAARRRALACDVPLLRIEQVGHPIHPRVAGLVHEREALRERYRWREPVVLITGGSSGVGIPDALAAAHDHGARVVVVCGHDQALREQLSHHDVEVLGFVDDLPERMCAADLVLAKAGPSTLAECRAVGTPVLVTSHMPGQERGNLHWVRDAGFGEVAERPEEVPLAIERWLAHEPRRARLRQAALDDRSVPACVCIAEQLLELAHTMQTRGAA